METLILFIAESELLKTDMSKTALSLIKIIMFDEFKSVLMPSYGRHLSH